MEKWVSSTLKQKEIPEELSQKPIIVDADGLKLMSKIKDWPELLSQPSGINTLIQVKCQY